MQNILSMAHVYKSCSYLCGQKPERDFPLSRNPHFGWSQTRRCLLHPQIDLLPVSPSPRVGAKALHLPTKHFPFQDGSDDAVRGLLCRRGCRIIAELCRFPYQPRLLVGSQEQLDMRTPHACSREKFYLTHVRLLSEVSMGGWRQLIITRIKCASSRLWKWLHIAHTLAFLLSASQRYQLFH